MFTIKNEKKGRAVPIILIIIAIAVMLPVILSLFIGLLPIFLLGIFGFLIFLLIRLILFKSKKPKDIKPQEQPVVTQQPQNETELSIMQRAFGLLQKRITEQVTLQYPNARWVWGTPNSFERFINNEPLIVFLNSAAQADSTKRR